MFSVLEILHFVCKHVTSFIRLHTVYEISVYRCYFYQNLFKDAACLLILTYLLHRPFTNIKLVVNEPKGLRTNFTKWRDLNYI